jgi:hypothetical protein
MENLVQDIPTMAEVEDDAVIFACSPAALSEDLLDYHTVDLTVKDCQIYK